jgi:membrane peptidoglycan carboxypeptidase
VQLLELANAYRALASSVSAEPHVVARVSGASGEALFTAAPSARPLAIAPEAVAAIQEGLRGVVRLPSGTAHALAADEFGIPVMGKTGTSSDFRDALFVGSTYGPEGVTVAVRIGYDDNRELGEKETGGRAALPIFRDVVQGIYTQGLTGTAPVFPEEMEQRITDYVAAAVEENSQEWAATETAPVFEPAVLPARLMPALALTPVALPPSGPLFDPARSDRRFKRP